MSIAQQGMLIMGIIFCIPVIPAIIYTIYMQVVLLSSTYGPCLWLLESTLP